MKRFPFLVITSVFLASLFFPVLNAAPLSVAEEAGRLEVREGERVLLGWQASPMTAPKGGEKFAGSAFLHPLCTPSGFVVTCIQPSDHLHHFGVWWPWKYFTVDGQEKKLNGWEIQSGEARTVADKTVDAKIVEGTAVLQVRDRIEAIKGQAKPTAVIDETVKMLFSRPEEDMNVLDIAVDHQAVKGRKVTIEPWRYSGFSWRGPLSWNQKNSEMRTSAGKNRDNANHTPARWVAVEGPRPEGRVTVVIMSAAEKVAGNPELLRVWGSKMHGGMPFVNFNPVVKEAQPLDEAHPAVSMRRYRLLLADRVLKDAEINKAWSTWVKDVGQ